MEHMWETFSVKVVVPPTLKRQISGLEIEQQVQETNFSKIRARGDHFGRRIRVRLVIFKTVSLPSPRLIGQHVSLHARGTDREVDCSVFKFIGDFQTDSSALPLSPYNLQPSSVPHVDPGFSLVLPFQPYTARSTGSGKSV